MSPSIRQSVRDALDTGRPVLLAVSGGIDSAVLLDAAVATTAIERIVVATFDHGTGRAATAAAEFVARRADQLGVRCVRGQAGETLRSEAALRAARWTFLREQAGRIGADIATAHTADDQIETVLMRAIRGAGARGLAGLAAPSDVIRPLLAHRRQEIEAYAREYHVSWVDDPTNESRMFFRNRVRHDLLPAMRRVRTSIDDELCAIGARAAEWRVRVEAIVAELGLAVVRDGEIDVAAAGFGSFRADELRIIWPVVAARAGLALDRRSIDRLARFTHAARVGARMQIAGGWQVVRSREHLELRRVADLPTPAPLTVSEVTTWGAWRFRRGESGDAWAASLPPTEPISVRAWQPGDRLEANGRERKVKELLTRAGVTGHRRAGWPVVLAGDRIVWVPGVGRSDAATARPGRPGLPFLCEHITR